MQPKYSILKKFPIVFIIAALAALFFTNCSNCESEKLVDLTFTPAEISLLPYADISSLTFKDSLGDSLCYDRIAPLSNVMCKYQQRYNQSCIGNYRWAQEVEYTMQCRSDTSYYITIQLAFGDVWRECTKLFNLDFYYHYMSASYYFHGEYLIINSAPANPFPYNPYCCITGIYPAFTLQGHTYDSVYVLQMNDFPVTTVYYSVTQGIVGYKEYLGKVWYLVKAI